MLQTIEAALKEVCEPVFYGAANDLNNAALWNYIVFFRERTTRSASNKGFSDYFRVGIVHENWVPAELIEAVIEKMEQISGMRLANEQIDFDYTVKPGTSAIVEVASLAFVRPRKRG